MVPPSTIARVFAEVSFSNDNTRITASAVALSAEYIRLFVSEAVSRANAERASDERPTEVDGIDNVASGDAVLDVQDQFGELSDEYDDEERGSGVPSQVPPPSDANDTLTTRHLAGVGGLLVMDF